MRESANHGRIGVEMSDKIGVAKIEMRGSFEDEDGELSGSGFLREGGGRRAEAGGMRRAELGL